MNLESRSLRWPIDVGMGKVLVMSSNRIAALFLGICGMLLLPAQSTPAQTSKPDSQGHTILFVCEHGSAKSVIAAAHFNDLAKKDGLSYRAIARGVHPDKEIPLYIKNGLAGEGLNIRGWQPKRFSEEDVLNADRIITLGCALPTTKSVITQKLEDWKDLPSVSENYQNASQAIAERVRVLLRALTSKPPIP
jgi:arsenate reductase (thioredoxin)